MHLTDPKQRVIVLPMNPQPVGELDVAGTYDHENAREVYYEDSLGSTFEAPVRVGERIHVREEFYFDDYSKHIVIRGENLLRVNMGDGIFDITPERIPTHKPKWASWQPASTMPDFAVRHWRVVKKVEAKKFFSINQDTLIAARIKGAEHWDADEPQWNSNEDYTFVIHVEPEESR